MSEAKQYRKKPVTVEAIQWTGDNYAKVKSFCDGSTVWDGQSNLFIPTLEGDMCAWFGDYIIKGVNGEFYPCKPDIFAKTYEDAAEPTNDTAAIWQEAMEAAGNAAIKKANTIQSLMEGSDEDTFAVQSYAAHTAREIAKELLNTPNPYEAKK